MTETLRFEIITPQAIGVYPLHVRLITQVVPGEIILNRGAEESFFAVGEGLVDIGPRHVAIVTDMAIPADRIDEAHFRTWKSLAD